MNTGRLRLRSIQPSPSSPGGRLRRRQQRSLPGPTAVTQDRRWPERRDRIGQRARVDGRRHTAPGRVPYRFGGGRERSVPGLVRSPAHGDGNRDGVDAPTDPMPRKIRAAQRQKIPFIVIAAGPTCRRDPANTGASAPDAVHSGSRPAGHSRQDSNVVSQIDMHLPARWRGVRRGG
jgi:hypothetical protein